jgi:putative membrane protein
MQNLIIRIFVNAVALWIAARLVGGIELTTEFWPMLGVAVVFGLLNALIKPIALLLSLPFLILTLGLFTLVINALMLMLTAALLDALSVAGFWDAFWGAILISIVSFLFSMILPDRSRGPHPELR